jgi:DNA-binding NtrC family response regulator
VCPWRPIFYFAGQGRFAWHEGCKYSVRFANSPAGQAGTPGYEMARILVVDDDDNIRTMLRRILERDAHDVVTAENGLVAVRQQKATPSDVIILDIIMPEKEGLETIMELRRDDPGVKIIAISGGGQLGPSRYLMLAKAMGAIFAFEKPVPLEALREAIRMLTLAAAY